MRKPALNGVLVSTCTLACIAALLNGCGELAYKRGANGYDLAAARTSCRELGLDGEAVQRCLESKGWAVHNMDRMEAMAADPVIEATLIPSNLRMENASPMPQRNSVSGIPLANDPSTPITSAVARPPEQTDRFNVSSWWKTGGTAAGLQTDTEACVTQLGESHRPDIHAQPQTATRALLHCMKEKGWSALRAH